MSPQSIFYGEIMELRTNVEIIQCAFQFFKKHIEN